MALFDREISTEAYALVRYGVGYPARGAPLTAAGLLQRLEGPDTIAAQIPTVSFSASIRMAQEFRVSQRARRRGMQRGEEEYRTARRKLGVAYFDTLIAELSRAAETDDPFRERLQQFWANHFAARNKSYHLHSGAAGYAEEAIRPHVNGSFADMLKAAVTHPFLMVYLDQTTSIGPNSRIGKRDGKGLNENLAREVLELHTLGVGGPYTQADVTQLAELLTGLMFTYRSGFVFHPKRAEPGAEQVLGREYGGDGKAELADIHAVLEDLAVHPATARFICHKLAAHFVGDVPDPDLVAQMEAAFVESDGQLGHVYAAMLDHPAAWSGFGAKVKWPLQFMGSSLRALGARAGDLQALNIGHRRLFLRRPLEQMGQGYKQPPGPDGWPDTAEAWINPHRLAARIDWAMRIVREIPKELPDPRQFVTHALGDLAGEDLTFAANAAESRPDGIGIILSSAEFNRR